ncbi:hypothetical protein BJ741DRAFT_712524 [Chytriomyces cf. hyalinus JEL632]|nr:hypothetical protein BJ741DRAFT_712524 [Chytriomyces cf. hyalinus JEL632]
MNKSEAAGQDSDADPDLSPSPIPSLVVVAPLASSDGAEQPIEAYKCSFNNDPGILSITSSTLQFTPANGLDLNNPNSVSNNAANLTASIALARSQSLKQNGFSKFGKRMSIIGKPQSPIAASPATGFPLAGEESPAEIAPAAESFLEVPSSANDIAYMGRSQSFDLRRLSFRSNVSASSTPQDSPPVAPSVSIPLSAITSITRARTKAILVAPNALLIESRNIDNDFLSMSHTSKYLFTNVSGIKLSALESKIAEHIDLDRVRRARSLLGSSNENGGHVDGGKRVVRRTSQGGVQTLFNLLKKSDGVDLAGGGLSADHFSDIYTQDALLARRQVAASEEEAMDSQDSMMSTSAMDTTAAPQSLHARPSYNDYFGASKVLSDALEKSFELVGRSSSTNSRTDSVQLQTERANSSSPSASSIADTSTTPAAMHPQNPYMLPKPRKDSTKKWRNTDSSKQGSNLRLAATDAYSSRENRSDSPRGFPSILKMRSNPVMSPTNPRSHPGPLSSRASQKSNNNDTQAYEHTKSLLLQHMQSNIDNISAPPRTDSRNKDRYEEGAFFNSALLDNLQVDYNRLTDLLLAASVGIVFVIVVVDFWLIFNIVF